MPVSEKFIYVTSGSYATITGYTDCLNSAGDVIIPATINDGTNTYNVISIGDEAFKYCTGLKSVIIPNSVTSIGMHAFYNCSNLRSVSIPNSVTSIGSGAFGWCTSLLTVTIPNSVTSIDDEAFTFCTSLTDVIILNGVTSIGMQAFYNCYRLISVSIPNSVTSIGSAAFNSCRSLISVSIPDSVTSIGYSAFGDCISLTSATISNSLTSISFNTFIGCISLTNVNIPNSITSIDNSAFYNCTHLVSAYFFGDAPTIGNDVFFNNASNFKIYYLYGATGFSTPTWQPPNTPDNYNTETFYMVTYDGNGSTSGTVPEDSNVYLQGEVVIVLGNVGSLVKEGYTFVGWNTEADGTGINYALGTSFTVENTNMTLYATWQGPLLISSTLIGTLLNYNDDISNIERMILKKGYHSTTIIPSTAESGNTFTLNNLTLNTSSISNSYIKLDFASNIVITSADRKISFQIFKLYKNALMPVGSMLIFSGTGEVSTIFSFFAYDYNSYHDENLVYTVVATIL